MMRSDNLNRYDHNSYTKMTAPYLNVNVTNEGKSKHRIVNKPLSQKCSADENELHSTKEDELECVNRKQKDAKNEVAYDVKN